MQAVLKPLPGQVLVDLKRGGGILTYLPEADLIKTLGRKDDAVECTEIVEYCLRGCAGQAHKTDRPDSESNFCDRHVHRSAHVHLKTALFGIPQQGQVNQPRTESQKGPAGTISFTS